jgi:hypothetical protein
MAGICGDYVLYSPQKAKLISAENAVKKRANLRVGQKREVPIVLVARKLVVRAAP